MTRILLLALVAILVGLYFPRSRAVIIDVARPALTPVFRWQTLGEMNRIAREVQTHERESFGQLPDQRRFPAWLAGRFDEPAVTDSWGQPYTLVTQGDSFFIVSWGPDAVARTDDDLRVARPRARSIRSW